MLSGCVHNKEQRKEAGKGRKKGRMAPSLQEEDKHDGMATRNSKESQLCNLLGDCELFVPQFSHL
jgi:hypothetical protein